MTHKSRVQFSFPASFVKHTVQRYYLSIKSNRMFVFEYLPTIGLDRKARFYDNGNRTFLCETLLSPHSTLNLPNSFNNQISGNTKLASH